MHVGIDLGTTHAVLAFARADEVEIFRVEQLTAPHESDRLPLLPSVLYAPLAGEVDERFALRGWIAGELARVRAGEVAGRAIASAKSWLGYGEVDRTAAILPWRLEADDDAPPRISPVEAQRLLIAHLRRAWDGPPPQEPLAKLRVTLTVPASFDAVARELTLRAAHEAGIEPRLLEEPQAAFYDWAESDERIAAAVPEHASEGRVLVVDVGGGTTDLSLIRVRREASGFALARIATGRHMLLGGDNMDLALAHRCEERLAAAGALPSGEKLSARRFAELAQQARAAKERLLALGAPAAATVALHGAGSRMLGGGLAVELGRAECEELLADGFFPRVPLAGAPRPRAAVVAFGLPYERDVAITRHVAAFAARHGLPTALLLNGGVFHAPALATRLHEVVQSWADHPITRLPVARPAVAVARGAVRYALGLSGRGRTIGAGAARGYYVGVAPEPGEKQRRAVCVLPHGASEGHSHRSARAFELVVGRDVQFELWSGEATDAVGQLVTIDDGYERLPPLCLALEGEGAVKVELEAQLSAVGTLELGAVEDGGRRHRLSFDLRAAGAASPTTPSTPAPSRGQKIPELAAAVERVFGKGASAAEREVKGLFRELERIAGKKSGWDAELCRGLYDRLCAVQRGRRHSADHERVFWQLAGYCLRPGAGAARDPERVRALFALFDQRLGHAGELRGWQHFWIAWRRIAAGLDDAAQARIRDALDPFFAPAELKLKKEKAFRNDATAEMLELLAGLERLPQARRGDLGSWIVERTWTDRDPRLWSALGRVGARIPAYASVHHVVAARTVGRWLDHLLREKWADLPTAPAAALAIGRLTGDRERDLPERARQQIDKRLASLGIAEAVRRPLHEVIALGGREQADFYGEDLPPGLRLA